jgi:hypothetical protein
MKRLACAVLCFLALGTVAGCVDYYDYAVHPEKAYDAGAD